MDFSKRFNEEALSDIVLHLRPHTLDDLLQINLGSRKRPGTFDEAACAGRSFFLHRIVLFQALYFEKMHGWGAQIASAVAAGSSAQAAEPSQVSAGATMAAGRKSGKRQPKTGTEPPASSSACAACAARAALSMPAISAKPELVEHVEEGELDAVELMLKCLYKVELPQEAQGNGHLLLQVYRMADKYKVPAPCMETISAALSAVEAKDIDLLLLLKVYHLPPGLMDSLPLQKLITMSCKQKLVELFGDVPAIITDPEQRRQFCALPYVAALAWLQSDDLKVHSESCVLFLLSAWVHSKEHPACSPDQLKQLAHSVRVEHLSDVYWQSVVPDLTWFMESDGCGSRGTVGLLRIMQLRKSRPDAGHADWTGPPAWSSGKRKGTAVPESVALIQELDSQDILKLDATANQTLYSSNNTYLNGVFYKLGHEKRKVANSSEAAVTFGMFLCPDVKAMQAALGFWDCTRHPCLFSAELSASTKMKRLQPVISSSSAWGFPDILGKSAATVAELFAPFLVDGRLSLKAVIMDA